MPSLRDTSPANTVALGATISREAWSPGRFSFSSFLGQCCAFQPWRFFPSLQVAFVWAWLVLTVALLVGCAGEPVVTLHHPQTGQVVRCGPYQAVTWAQSLAAVERERGCVADYHRQGYERR